MPKLRCSVRNCAHNKEDYCSLGYIEVDGERAESNAGTCCANFDQAYGGASNDLVACQPVVEIQCNAMNCIYNRDDRCGANAVNMAGATTANATNDTACGSFWSI